LIFLDGDGAVSVMERKLTAGSRRKKNITPARARRGESPPRGNVFVEKRRVERRWGYMRCGGTIAGIAVYCGGDALAVHASRKRER